MFLGIDGKQNNTTVPPGINPSIYTIGVDEGDAQVYNISQAYLYGEPSSFIHETELKMDKGQEFMVKMTQITANDFSYEIRVKQENGSYKLEQSRSFSIKYYPPLLNAFITTTNRSFIEARLKTLENYNYTFEGDILNVTADFWDYGWEASSTKNWLFDLRAGWLIYFHTKAENKTHVINEYEITCSKIDEWLRVDSTDDMDTPLSVIWLGSILPILWFHRRRKNLD
jgi:hypothetical protein